MLEFNGTTIVIAISFIIFVILENFIFYRPMKKTLDERAKYIAENEQETDKNTSITKSLLEEKDNKISEARSKSATIVNETSLKSQNDYAIAIKNAKEASHNEVNNAKIIINQSKVDVQNTLHSQVGDFASAIVSKILKEDTTLVNVSDEMIDKALRGEL